MSTDKSGCPFFCRWSGNPIRGKGKKKDTHKGKKDTHKYLD